MKPEREIIYQPFGDVYFAFEPSGRLVGAVRWVGRIKTRDHVYKPEKNANINAYRERWYNLSS